MLRRAAVVSLAVLAAAAPAGAYSPGRTVRRDYLHSAVRLTGQVVDPWGHDAARVPVVVYAADLSLRSPWTPLTFAASGPRGGWSVVVPRGGPRVLAVNAGGQRLLTVRETVAPSIWFRAALRGRRLTFFGRIWPAGLTPTLVLKDRAPGGWQTFAVGPVRPSGAFRVVYRAGAGIRGLRVRIRATTFPYAGWRAGASAVREVVVP